MSIFGPRQREGFNLRHRPDQDLWHFVTICALPGLCSFVHDLYLQKLPTITCSNSYFGWHISANLIPGRVLHLICTRSSASLAWTRYQLAYNAALAQSGCDRPVEHIQGGNFSYYRPMTAIKWTCLSGPSKAIYGVN